MKERREEYGNNKETVIIIMDERQWRNIEEETEKWKWKSLEI